MGHVVGICDFNFLEDDFLANRYVSSEKAAYPSDNVYNLHRRTKVWRTDGFYRIVSGEDTIVFRESVGVDLTATVSAGDYATPALFFAAVKTALEAVGVATYTVEYHTNGKIKITSNLGGGATVFQLITTDANFADMAEVLGFDTSANYTGASTYTADVLRIHTEEHLVWDLGFPTNPKAFILVGDRNTPLKITPSAVVKLEGNWTNAWSSPAISLTIPYDEYVLARWDFENGLATNTYGYRYWRVQIVDPENPRQYVEFGAAYLGSIYYPTQNGRGCAVYPLEFSPQDLSNVSYAEAGQTFSQSLPNTEGVSLTWDAVSKPSEQSLRQFWERKKRVNPFFMILDSDEQTDGTGAFSENMKERVKLVKFQVEPRVTLTSTNWFQIFWGLREEL